MLNQIQTLKNKTTAHIYKHRAKYAAGTAIAATTAVAIKLHNDVIEEANGELFNFMQDHGLTVEFYNLDSIYAN